MFKKIYFFSEKMKMKNLPFSEGMISESYEAYHWNPQASLNINIYLILHSGHMIDQKNASNDS